MRIVVVGGVSGLITRFGSFQVLLPPYPPFFTSFRPVRRISQRFQEEY